MFAFAVVQLYPRHGEERERAASPGGAAALRCGQSGASGGYCSSQPGDGQKEQRPHRYRLVTFIRRHVTPHLHTHTVSEPCRLSVITGNYALRDLVGNLPCGQQHPAKNLDGDTVVSILNTIHEIISDSPENARALIQGHAVQKLVSINKSRYSST